MSVAAGPVGRSSEAAGTIANLAPIYSYSKSKGLFAGISLEGSIIITRGDANQKFYSRKVSAKEILTGAVEPPAIAEALYRALDLRFAAPSIKSNDNNSANIRLSTSSLSSSSRQTRHSQPLNSETYVDPSNQRSYSDQNTAQAAKPQFSRPPPLSTPYQNGSDSRTPGRPTPPSSKSISTYQDGLPPYQQLPSAG